MTTVELGRQAEQVAAAYIAKLGFRIIDRNWSVPKLCEIDLVAFKGGRVYFIEVKYRLSEAVGAGLEYITPQKLRHMRRAAAIWVRHSGFRGGYDIGAIEVTGRTFTIGNFVESIY